MADVAACVAQISEAATSAIGKLRADLDRMRFTLADGGSVADRLSELEARLPPAPGASRQSEDCDEEEDQSDEGSSFSDGGVRFLGGAGRWGSRHAFVELGWAVLRAVGL